MRRLGRREGVPGRHDVIFDLNNTFLEKYQDLKKLCKFSSFWIYKKGIA